MATPMIKLLEVSFFFVPYLEHGRFDTNLPIVELVKFAKQ